MSMMRCAALSIALAATLTLTHTAKAAELKLEADLGQNVLSTAKPGTVYLRLSLKSLAGAKREHRTPINAAIVIDRSGSMQGDRIAAAKEGARVALKRLSSDDKVALVAYNHEVEVLSPAAPLRNSREKLIEAIDGLRSDGTTALHAGVKEGGRQVEEYLSENSVNRVILLSDGLANVGPSSPGDLAELGRKLASKGISVSTIGLGLDYNEDLMQRLAAASDGNHVFVERPSDLAEIFDREFGDALSISARDITIIIECKAGFTPKRILGRDGSIEGGKVTLKLNQLQAGNERYVVVELTAADAHGEGAADVADVRVTYTDLDSGKAAGVAAKPTVRFSSNAKDVEDSLNKPVMSQVTQQIATENSEQAVDLRDKGDVDGARKVLQENARYLKRSREAYASGVAPAAPASVGALSDLEKQSEEAANNLEAGSWDRTRKMMRYDQHKSKVQQAY
ncbi:MAG: VWA domain-containing protein [Hyphomicrobium sp.]